jgi:hypothetical protein
MLTEHRRDSQVPPRSNDPFFAELFIPAVLHSVLRIPVKERLLNLEVKESNASHTSG